LRRECGASADDFIIAVAAKLIPRKRVQDAILACGKIGKAARLWVIGEGSERGRLEALAEDHAPGQVHWHGFVNQSRIPALLSAADVFVLPSDVETWGLVVNEAMACGLPAVCSDRIGCAADLIREGMTGYVYPVGCVESLAARLSLLRLNRELARSMGKAARELVVNEYDVHTTARQIAAAARACCAAAV
jgi:glycosyltransferase involved in cell wall biosynthesis